MPRILARGKRFFRAPAILIEPARRPPIEASRALEQHLTAAIAATPVAAIAPTSVMGERVTSFEIKGLAAAVRDAKAQLAEARKGVVDLHQSSQALVATIAEAKRQIDQHHDDLRFDLTTLGNGSPES